MKEAGQAEGKLDCNAFVTEALANDTEASSWEWPFRIFPNEARDKDFQPRYWYLYEMQGTPEKGHNQGKKQENVL